ncbi:MAG: transcription antitermination factor NusB [Candidatus Gracilibacteria bacterium]
MPSHRHLSRIAVVQTLFAWEFRGGDPEVILQYVLTQFYPELTEVEFVKETLKGVLARREEIKTLITETAPEWSFEKIAPLDRVILEIGVYELIAETDVPPIVAINEAIEMAKQFGNTNAPKFINGVLSTVMKKCHKTPEKDKKKSVNPPSDGK